MRLSFVEPENTDPGQRTFDVSIQGELVQQGLDVAEEAGGSRRILVKEFRGVKAEREIAIAFSSKTGQALISGVEVLKEVN